MTNMPDDDDALPPSATPARRKEGERLEHGADNPDRKKRQDDLLDESVEETFPASDPISPKRIT